MFTHIHYERMAPDFEDAPAVKSRVETGRNMNLHFDHPILLIQLLIFHECYHHGQMKLALKVTGRPLTDDETGPLTWNAWRLK
jgi:hypothetical protein